MPEETDKLMTVREVAARLNISEITVRRWINRGLLNAVDLPSGSRWQRSIRIKESELAKVVREG